MNNTENNDNGRIPVASRKLEIEAQWEVGAIESSIAKGAHIATGGRNVIDCEVCGLSWTHIPEDIEASEIELVGFMGLTPDNEAEPRWMCGGCFEGIMSINPDATPMMFRKVVS